MSEYKLFSKLQDALLVLGWMNITSVHPVVLVTTIRILVETVLSAKMGGQLRVPLQT